MLELFTSLLRDTFVPPRPAADRLLAMNLPLGVGLLATAALASCSALASAVASLLLPGEVAGPLALIASSSLSMALVQGAMILLTAAAMAYVGQMLGGNGAFSQALTLTVWVEFVLFVVQLAQVVIIILFPLIGALLGLASVGLLIWLLVEMTMRLHGFQNPLAVLAGIIGTFLAIALIAGTVLAFLGITPQMGV